MRQSCLILLIISYGKSTTCLHNPNILPSIIEDIVTTYWNLLKNFGEAENITSAVNSSNLHFFVLKSNVV